MLDLLRARARARARATATARARGRIRVRVRAAARARPVCSSRLRSLAARARATARGRRPCCHTAADARRIHPRPRRRRSPRRPPPTEPRPAPARVTPRLALQQPLAAARQQSTPAAAAAAWMRTVAAGAAAQPRLQVSAEVSSAAVPRPRPEAPEVQAASRPPGPRRQSRAKRGQQLRWRGRPQTFVWWLPVWTSAASRRGRRGKRCRGGGTKSSSDTFGKSSKKLTGTLISKTTYCSESSTRYPRHADDASSAHRTSKSLFILRNNWTDEGPRGPCTGQGKSRIFHAAN